MERVKAIEDEGEVVVKVLRLATFLTLVRLFHVSHDFEELLTTNTIINISLRRARLSSKDTSLKTNLLLLSVDAHFRRVLVARRASVAVVRFQFRHSRSFSEVVIEIKVRLLWLHLELLKKQEYLTFV